jgi:uncharacterized membrane protein YdbT with pleckstrin-like domain
MGYVDNNLLPGERVVYRAQIHWSFYLTPISWLLLSVILAAWGLATTQDLLRSMACTFAPLLLLGGFVGLAAAALAAGSIEFAVTDRRIIAKGGVLRRRSIEILLSKVESITFSQPLLGMIFNYGTVVVAGTGGTREAFRNIANPQELRRQVHARLQETA